MIDLKNRSLGYDITDLLPSAPNVSDYFKVSRNSAYSGAFFDNVSPNNLLDGYVGGILQSGNFMSGLSGWRITPDGDAEFNDAVIRGTIVIGGEYITVSTSDSIQDAIDQVNAAGGGVVVLENGTHTPGQSITLYSKVTLQGQNGNSAIIDFQGGAYSVKGIGSGAYTTGTVSVSNNGTTVTGSGTSWSGNVTAGQYILLAGIWYPVTAVGGNTTLTIGIPYADTTLSGAAYTAATILSNVHLNALTVTNSIDSAVKFQYVTDLFIDDVTVTASLVGVEINTCSQITFANSNSIANYTNYSWTNTHFCIHTGSSSIDALVGNGYTLNTVTNSAISACFVLNSAGDGMNITSSSNMRIDGVFAENGGSGVEFVSGNNNIVFGPSRVEGNATDGVKLTASSDNIFIQSGYIQNNTGYGINIAASSNDNCVVTGNNFSGNTTDAVNDSGTGTVIRGNVGVTDNSTNAISLATSFVAGENLTAGNAVCGLPYSTSVIAFDTSFTMPTTGTVSSKTQSFTVGNNSNRVLVVVIQRNNITNGSISSVTYAGVALTQITTGTWGANVNNNLGIWYLVAPATGANNLIITDSATAQYTANIYSYYNCAQTATPEANASAANSSDPTTATLTSLTNGALIFGAVANSSGGVSGSAYVNNTIDQSGNPASGDSGTLYPMATKTLDANRTGGQNKAAQLISIAPVSTSPTVRAYKARATLSATALTYMGFAQETKTSGNSVKIDVSGINSSQSGLTPGTNYYLSDTAGALSSSPGTVTKKAAAALSAKQVVITNIW